MGNKAKDNREEQRIEREAEKWVKEFYNVSNYQPVLKEVRKESYIAGATKEAARNKEDAIGFAEWASWNYWHYSEKTKYWVDSNLTRKLTTEQLYEIYINQKV